MRFTRLTGASSALVIAVTALLAACAGQGEDLQTITGQVMTSDFSAPVVGVRVVQDDTIITSSPIDANGRFSVGVPAGEAYRMEVVTRDGTYPFVRRENTRVVAHSFNVCEPSDDFDLGDVDQLPNDPDDWDDWDDGNGEPPWGDDEPPWHDDGDCGDPPPPCDDMNDPDCGPPDPCQDMNDPACWPPDPCEDPADPNCLPPDPCQDPMDPNCWPPDPCDLDPSLCDPCDPGPNGECMDPPTDPCSDMSDPNSCWPDDPECPYDDPWCWPDPTDPPCADPNNAQWCWPDDAAYPDNVPPDFGCEDV